MKQTLRSHNSTLRRTPIKRRPVDNAPVAQFDIVTKDGDVYPWPAKFMDEVREWQPTVIAWAKLGDPKARTFHVVTTKTSDGGWFDLAIMQPTRGKGFLRELKVRDRHGVANGLSKEQQGFAYDAIASGWDAACWTWPDDGREAFETLTDYDWTQYWRFGRLVKR